MKSLSGKKVHFEILSIPSETEPNEIDSKEDEKDKENEKIMKKLSELSKNELEAWSFLFHKELNEFIRIINNRKPNELLEIDENDFSDRDEHWDKVTTSFNNFVKEYDSLRLFKNDNGLTERTQKEKKIEELEKTIKNLEEEIEIKKGGVEFFKKILAGERKEKKEKKENLLELIEELINSENNEHTKEILKELKNEL